MKWNIGGWLIAFGMVAALTGCGGKEPTPPAPAPTDSVASAPVAGTVAPSMQSSETSAPQTSAAPSAAASQPTRPTFGFGGPASPADGPSEAPAASSSNRPQLSVGGGAPTTPVAAGQGGPQLLGAGGSGALPAAGTFAGTGNPPSETTPNDNPFEDPSNLLPPTIELSLQDRAINAFKVGNVTRAYGLYQGHLLSLPSDELEGAMQNMRWDKKRVVPRLGYSFAVGLIVNNPGKVESLKPIGTASDDLKGSASGSGSPGRPGFGGPGGPGFGAPSGSSATPIPTLPAKELSDAAGKFASTFVSSFNRAHSDGKWSEAFREYEFGSSLNMPTTSSGIGSGFAGGAGSLGAAGPIGGGPVAGGGPPAGYGGPSGPPAGYGGGQGGPPAGYSGGGGPPAGYAGGPGSGAPPGYGGAQGGPPAGYQGGPGAGAPPGYGGAQGGPPAGYQGGPGAGAPPGYGGGQGGPPAGYSGGPNAGAPPGYGAPGGAAPGGGQPAGGGQPPKPGQGGSGSNSGFEYIAPQDDAIGASGPSTTQAGPPTAASPTAGGPGFGAPGFGGSGFGGPSAPPPATLDPAIAKDLQIPSGTIPLGAGLNYIGKGESVGELTKMAVEQGYDALIVFEVDVSLVRVNRTIKNDCRIRAVSLKGELDAKERSITSSLLNNNDVAKDKEPDARIGTAVDNFMKKLVEAYPMDELPKFKAESIQTRRLKDLVNDKVRSKLDLLCEVELYASKGLIDNTLKEAAFERIAGSDGKVVATSEPEDRIEILEKLIRQQLD